MKLKNFIKKFFNRKHLISQISGRVFFKYNPSEISKIDLIRKQFFNLNIDLKKNKFSSFIFMDKENASIVLKYKLNNIIFSENNRITYNFLDQIYSSFSKKKYSTKFFLPLCGEQIAFAKKKIKLNVSTLKCKFYFTILILNNLVKGFIFGFYIFFRSIINIFNLNKNEINKKIIFFDIELRENDLDFIEKKEYFIINKFFKKYRLNKNEFIIIVKPKKSDLNNKIKIKDGYIFKFSNDPYPNFNNLIISFQFIIWQIVSFMICIKDLLCLRWYNSFLFFEAVKSKLFFYNQKYIPKFFITPYMGSLKRHLWTFDHKNLISRCSLFFYSTNGEGYETKFNKPNDTSNWGELDYNNYLVWDKFQKKILKEKLKVRNPKINIFGPMLSKIENDKLENIENEKYILMFDIVPEKLKFEYFTSYSIINGGNLVKFQKDIIDIAKDLNLKIIHKQKRSRDLNRICRKYKQSLDLLKKFENYTILSDKYSLEELIRNSLCCISYPYVTAALMAKDMKKPTVYYDSSREILNKEKRIESHDVEIINNKTSLENWVKKTIQN